MNNIQEFLDEINAGQEWLEGTINADMSHNVMVSQGQLSQIINLKQGIKLDTARAIAAAFDRSVDEVFPKGE